MQLCRRLLTNSSGCTWRSRWRLSSWVCVVLSALYCHSCSSSSIGGVPPRTVRYCIHIDRSSKPTRSSRLSRKRLHFVNGSAEACSTGRYRRVKLLCRTLALRACGGKPSVLRHTLSAKLLSPLSPGVGLCYAKVPEKRLPTALSRQLKVRCRLRERQAGRSGIEHDQNGWGLTGHASVHAVNRFGDSLSRDKALSAPAPFLLEGELS